MCMRSFTTTRTTSSFATCSTSGELCDRTRSEWVGWELIDSCANINCLTSRNQLTWSWPRTRPWRMSQGSFLKCASSRKGVCRLRKKQMWNNVMMWITKIVKSWTLNICASSLNVRNDSKTSSLLHHVEMIHQRYSGRYSSKCCQ